MGLSFGELSNKARFMDIGAQYCLFCPAFDLWWLLSMSDMEGFVSSSVWALTKRALFCLRVPFIIFPEFKEKTRLNILAVKFYNRNMKNDINTHPK